MERVKMFLSHKKIGWYVSAASFLFGLLTLIVYTARGGNYLSPVSPAAVTLLVFAILTNALVLFVDFKIAAVIPMILFDCVLAILLNTEMLFITNVAFGVDGNYLDGAFFTFVITEVLAVITSSVAFAMGLSKKE
ncbi:MAG: hypothetical protein ACI4TN_01905 [Candidatus Enterosoma sp.]